LRCFSCAASPTHPHTHNNTHINTHTLINAPTHSHIYTHRHTYTQAHIHTHITHTQYIHTHTQEHVRTHTHTYTHTHIRLLIYTHTYKLLPHKHTHTHIHQLHTYVCRVTSTTPSSSTHRRSPPPPRCVGAISLIAGPVLGEARGPGRPQRAACGEQVTSSESVRSLLRPGPGACKHTTGLLYSVGSCAASTSSADQDSDATDGGMRLWSSALNKSCGAVGPTTWAQQEGAAATEPV
jgi:hypothetical protein